MQPISPHRNLLGEGPTWSVERQRLLWVDIWAREVHEAALDGSEHRRWPVPTEVGCAVPTRRGDVVVALRDGLSRLDLATGAVTPLLEVEADRPGQRFNDGTCDRRGRLWFGSMDEAERDPVGALYRYDPDGGCRRVLDGVFTSNGLGWSADGTTMYHTDSGTRRISVYEYDPVTGEPSGGRTFAEDPPDRAPDGLAVDAEGCVWSAKWGGGEVVRYAPDGSVDRRLPVPVSHPTSCAFAGPGLATLVVTTARPDRTAPDGTSLAGAVLAVEVDVPGVPEVPFAG